MKTEREKGRGRGEGTKCVPEGGFTLGKEGEKK